MQTFEDWLEEIGALKAIIKTDVSKIAHPTDYAKKKRAALIRLSEIRKMCMFAVERANLPEAIIN